VAATTARLLSDLPVQDLSIEDVPIESVIERAFQEGDESPQPQPTSTPAARELEGALP